MNWTAETLNYENFFKHKTSQKNKKNFNGSLHIFAVKSNEKHFLITEKVKNQRKQTNEAKILNVKFISNNFWKRHERTFFNTFLAKKTKLHFCLVNSKTNLAYPKTGSFVKQPDFFVNNCVATLFAQAVYQLNLFNIWTV